MAKIELNVEEFLEECKSDKETLKGAYTGREIAQFLSENALSKKALGTLESMSKDKLIALALEGDKEEPTPKKNTTGADSLAKTIIGAFDEAKKELHGAGLNKFIKDKAVNTTQDLLNKIQPENIKKIGYAGHIIVYGLLLLDVAFKDLKELPKKLMAITKPKKHKETVKAK